MQAFGERAKSIVRYSQVPRNKCKRCEWINEKHSSENGNKAHNENDRVMLNTFGIRGKGNTQSIFFRWTQASYFCRSPNLPNSGNIYIICADCRCWCWLLGVSCVSRGVGIDARLYEMNAFPLVFVLTSADKAHMQYEFVVPRTFQCVHQMYSFYAMFLFGLMDFKRNVHRRARSRK